MVGAFGRKPSNAHVVWTTGSDDVDDGNKRFDFQYLELWTAHFGIDFEKRTRVDHERADEPREQHACVFEWTRTDGETISLGEETWEMGNKRTPRTFLEIDDAGMARLKAWSREVVYDVVECWLDGPLILIRTRDSGNVKIDGRKLLRPERRPSPA